MTRTTQVTLIDGTTVTVREPEWCTGRHQDGEHLVDLTHDSAETFMTVGGEHGTWQLLGAVISSSPFAEKPAHRHVRVCIDMGGEDEGFDPAQIEAFADALVEHAQVLRELGRQVQQLRDQEEQS